MRQIELGNSVLGIPAVAVGTMYFGTLVEARVSHNVLDAALDAGATFLDTANNYAFWVEGGTGNESETVLGDWLTARPGARDRVTLATKIGARPRSDSRRLDKGMGLSASAVRVQVEDSLRRLRTDHVDVLYAHIDDTVTPLKETIGALQEEVRQGRARAIACSNITAPRLRAALDHAGDGPRYVATQQRFSYLSPRQGADLTPHVLLDDELVAVCTAADVTMIGYSPLLSGAYTRPDRPLPDAYQHPGAQEQLRVLHQAAETTGLDAGQVVLTWMSQRRFPVIPVVGVSTVAQLESAVRAVDTPLDAEVLAALEDARSAGW